ncbi:MAG: SRPBCC family protein [Solirubrobacterales bacterium]
MKPVTVSAKVPQPVEEVYDFLDVLANHEAFLDHFLVDWKFSGPRHGVGAKGEARASAPMSQDWTEFEVVEAERPKRIVEEGVGLKGKRHTRGTYRLEPLADGGTEISFELAWIESARAERLIPPMTRAFIKRPNAKAMRRLAKLLTER